MKPDERPELKLKSAGKCPKCGNDELVGGYPISYPQYIPLLPMIVQWAKEFHILGFLAKNSKTIVSYRCSKCGYLENYAN